VQSDDQTASTDEADQPWKQEVTVGVRSKRSQHADAAR
jgi:hypothetical protein